MIIDRMRTSHVRELQQTNVRMMNPNKQAPVRLILPKLVCHDSPKLIEHTPDTDDVGVNWHNVPEEERVFPTDN